MPDPMTPAIPDTINLRRHGPRSLARDRAREALRVRVGTRQPMR